MPVVPDDNDVLFGRGFTISAHPGNRHLRSIVQSQKPSFLVAKKKEKRKIARRIVDEITALDPPGRFLIEDPSCSNNNNGADANGSSGNGGGASSSPSVEKDGIYDKVWIPVETEKAVEKVMHRLRERERPPAGSSSMATAMMEAHHQNPQQQAQLVKQQTKTKKQQAQQQILLGVDPVSAAQQQAAAAQLALNPNLGGLTLGGAAGAEAAALGGGGELPTDLLNLQQVQQNQNQTQQQMQPQQQIQQPPPLDSAEDLNNFLQSMQQSIDNNFMATLASNNIGGSAGQQQQNNQNQQQTQTPSEILQQQLNALQQQQQQQQQQLLQSSNTNNLMQQQQQQQLNVFGQHHQQHQNQQNQLQELNNLGAPDTIQSLPQMNNNLPFSFQSQNNNQGGLQQADQQNNQQAGGMIVGNDNFGNTNSLFGMQQQQQHPSATSALTDGSNMNQSMKSLQQQQQNQQFDIMTNPLQQQPNQQNQQFEMTLNYPSTAAVSGGLMDSGMMMMMSQGNNSNNMNQTMNNPQQNNQQFQQFTIGMHHPLAATSGLTDTTSTNTIMNQGMNMNPPQPMMQTMPASMQNQQFVIQPSIGNGAGDETQLNVDNNFGNVFNNNNNMTSSPVPSSNVNNMMMNSNSPQITMMGGMNMNMMMMHSDSPALSDTQSQQSPNQLQQMMIMGSPVLSSGGMNNTNNNNNNNMMSNSLPQNMALTAGLSDASSVSTTGSTNTESLRNSFIVPNTTTTHLLEAIQEHKGGGGSNTTDHHPTAQDFDDDDDDDGDVMSSFLEDFTSTTVADGTTTGQENHPEDNDEESSSDVQQVTLQAWMDIFNPIMRYGYNNNYHRTAVPREMVTYIQSLVIPLAIKLTEHLIEQEKEGGEGEEGNNSLVEPSSVTCKNIMVLVKKEGTVIDQVRINNTSSNSRRTMSFDSNNSNNNNSSHPFIVAKGGDNKAPMLFAMGAILYEVLSREPLPSSSLNTTTTATAGLSEDELATVRRLSLGSKNANALDNIGSSSSEVEVDDRPSKRSQRRSRSHRSSFSTTNSENNASASNNQNHAQSITKLESIGVPYSMCALVRDLLDCAQGDFRTDNAYQTLSDVLTDLRLMHTDPECFLDNFTATASNNMGGPNPFLFEIRPKFYGRKGDVTKIEEAYIRHTNGQGCGGILMSGGAGVGKSSLVSEVTKKLTLQSNARYFDAKFDQNNDVSHPLSTIGAVFNSLCELFARDATQDQLDGAVSVLEKTLGSQVDLLVGVVPSLPKLMNISSSSSGMDGMAASNNCIDPAASMQFLLRKLLETLSCYWRMTFFLDDLQWADPASLLLLRSLISNTKESGNIFFACCYRDDDVQEGDSFTQWLSSINMFPLEVMELRDISIEGVNELISETLHLFPRITLPLASILHHKTMGNPLFLRQLLESLRDEGYIYFNFSPPRWSWDLNKIMEMKLSNNVLSLLIKDMQRLTPAMQLALKVASCIGTCAKYSTFDILSKNLNVNLRDLLSQVAKKGYMIDIDKNRIRWAHDKVQQAAYEMMNEEQRVKNHVHFGLAICANAFNGSSAENEDLFFLSVNQINRGGCDIIKNPNQKVMIAKLNLKAGKRSIELSDFSTALKLFEHGISFLDKEQRWTTHYDTCLELTDSALETACALNDAAVVRRLSEQVLAQSNIPSKDKLNCLYAVVKSLWLSFKFIDCKSVAFTMLEQMGERLPRSPDDVGLMEDIQEMRLVLQNMSDDSILDLHETNQAKTDILLLNLYNDLTFLFQFVDTTRLWDIHLRMAQVTLSNGLCIMSPLALAQFAITLINKSEDYACAYRLGTLSLRLLDKINAQRYTSAVIALVGHFVSWVSEPLQSIGESHLLGFSQGQRIGDVVQSTLNYNFYLQIHFFTGQALAKSRDKCREFALQLVQRKQQFLLNGASCLYHQAVAFINGLEFKEKGNGAEGLPTWEDIAQSPAGKNLMFYLVFATHRYQRAFMFKMYNDLPKDGMLNVISAKGVPLRPIFYYGIFYEGLVSYHLARQTDGDEYQRNGEAALIFFRNLSKASKWNFESKYLMLEAEMMKLSGYHTQASQLYEDAIRSSKEHKFIHEEAIASELAGTHFHEMELLEKSHALFSHSVECYKKWGALAISKRVEDIIESKFGSDFSHQPGSVDNFLASLLAPKGGSLKKRQE